MGRIHDVLRSALNTGVRRRLGPYNPAEHIELAPENHERAKPWIPEQCQARSCQRKPTLPLDACR